MKYSQIKELIDAAKNIVIIQADNPDGDSLGSALALEQALGNMDKNVEMFCRVNIPSYLRHLKGWDRVTSDFPDKAELAIIVDTSSATLLDKVNDSSAGKKLSKMSVIVIDHHESENDLPYETSDLMEPDSVATGEILYNFFIDQDIEVDSIIANNLIASIMADSLGLTTSKTTAKSIHAVASLVERGGSIAEVEEGRRKLMKKSIDITRYKAELLNRIELKLDGKLAIVTIPWKEIERYSDEYNPGALIIDEMRMIDTVEIALVLKTYPDGKITGKLRSGNDFPIAGELASKFGGGGHPAAAGFKIHDADLSDTIGEVVKYANELLEEG